MLDGRYYTYDQFASVIILTFLIAFMVVRTIGSYYRNKNSGNYITITFFLLTIIVIAKFIEQVIPSEDVAYMFRYGESVLFIISCNIFCYYLYVYRYPVFQSKLYVKKVNNYFIMFIFVVFLALSLIGVMTKGRFLISQYSFESITYGDGYIVLISIIVIMALIAPLKVLKSSEVFHKSYTNKMSSIFLFCFCFIQLLLYIVGITIYHANINYMEYVMLMLFALLINSVANTSRPFGLITNTFDKVGSMILDYVFVTDTSGHIIYKNSSVNSVDFFLENEEINLENIKKIFADKVIEKKNAGNEAYIQLIRENEKHYFTYKLKALKSNQKVVGHIITISEITELMELVLFLDEKKKKLEQVNQHLNDYSKVVYYLEKEKEINKLLEEIIATQEEAMEEMIRKIDGIIADIDKDEFEKSIDEIIESSSCQLDRVREAVMVYREYYGG